MEPGRIRGANLPMARPHNWDDATMGPCITPHVRLELMEDGKTPCMVSAWIPTQEEQLAILAGGAVYLRIVGRGHPAVALWAEAPRRRGAPGAGQSLPAVQRGVGGLGPGRGRGGRAVRLVVSVPGVHWAFVELGVWLGGPTRFLLCLGGWVHMGYCNGWWFDNLQRNGGLNDAAD
jgi:hypothetical protein